jgi:dipeptidyl aminopeptidase/acylaminoacyl peptidase
VYFTNYVDQRFYRQFPDSEAEPMTPAEKLRFADGIVDESRERLICVREDHRLPGEAKNELVALVLADNPDGGLVLASGNDFYSSPRLSPDGKRLAWIAWNHPNLPWDGTELWVADLDETGFLKNVDLVAGGKTESIFQPEWSPDGVLHFVSDRTGWWNLFRWRDDRVEPLCPMEAEFGKPHWRFGNNTYGFETAESIICSYTQNGSWHLARLNSTSGQLNPFKLPYSSIAGVKIGAGHAVFVGGTSTDSDVIARLNLATEELEVIRRANSLTVEPGYLSRPEPLEFPTENGLTAHAIYYRPHNQDYVGPPDEKPPLMVLSHGGPTGAASTSLQLKTQYWTSRGFAVLDVNYGGSTGYGRDYRERLYGQWGVVDVMDCINAARYLVDRGEADGDRLIIRGGSAGGFTTLCAITFHDVFDAGASHFGIGELEVFAGETHKFESRYLDNLIGPYPEQQDLYAERSALRFVDQIACPLILFQGLEDKIVPPNQAEMMFEVVRDRGLPVAYIPFEGEQHGFRQAKNIKKSLDSELYFYSQVFGFDLAVPVEPIRIENLDRGPSTRS